jgi:hypothetical protein
VGDTSQRTGTAAESRYPRVPWDEAVDDIHDAWEWTSAENPEHAEKAVKAKHHHTTAMRAGTELTAQIDGVDGDGVHLRLTGAELERTTSGRTR